MDQEEKQKLLKYLWHRHKESERFGNIEESERCKSEYYRLKNWGDLQYRAP